MPWVSVCLHAAACSGRWREDPDHKQTEPRREHDKILAGTSKSHFKNTVQNSGLWITSYWRISNPKVQAFRIYLQSREKHTSHNWIDCFDWLNAESVFVSDRNAQIISKSLSLTGLLLCNSTKLKFLVHGFNICLGVFLRIEFGKWFSSGNVLILIF